MSDAVENPEDRFSLVMAHMIKSYLHNWCYQNYHLVVSSDKSRGILMEKWHYWAAT